LKEELGSGGFGDVYKIEKLSTKEEMVMKVMKLGKESKKNVKAMEAEIQVGIKLQIFSSLDRFFFGRSMLLPYNGILSWW
jgi:serine/threonine protein kinase